MTFSANSLDLRVACLGASSEVCFLNARTTAAKRFGASRAKARLNSFCLLFEIEAKRASHSARSAAPRDPMISQAFLMFAGISKASAVHP